MTTSAPRFHPLTFVDEPDGVTVGRPDVDEYVTLPTDGAELLRRLAAGMPPDDAARWYHEAFGEPVDIADFLDSLTELGFVLGADEQPADTRRVRYQRLGVALFSPLACCVYAAVVAVAVVAMVRDPRLFPHPSNVFFTSSLVVVQITLFGLQIPATLLHEAAHTLAGRRLGLPSSLSISRRLYFVVFETSLNGLHSVPRNKRYLPFLAGVLVDVVLVALLTLLAAACGHGGAAWLGRVALAVAYTGILRIAWQFYVFLRTDFYYVLTNALRCTNLHEATSAYLRARLRWLPGRTAPATDSEQFTDRDRQVAPWFGWITMLGVLFLVGTTAFGIIPVAIDFIHRVSAAIGNGITDGAAFWDSLASITIVALQLVVAPLLAGRRRRTPARVAES